MSGKRSRSKGRSGESTALRMLVDRDYSVEDLTAGKACCDLLAIDKAGVVWSVEVKNRKIIDPVAFRAQAKRNAKPRTKWMTMAHYEGTSSWAVERQGMRPTFWHEKP